jgi:hypothetical protein
MSCANFSLRDGRLREAWHAPRSEAWVSKRDTKAKHVPIVSAITGYRIPCARKSRAAVLRDDLLS